MLTIFGISFTVSHLLVFIYVRFFDYCGWVFGFADYVCHLWGLDSIYTRGMVVA